MFPSTLSTFNRPNPTDRLNSPSHSALHNTVSSAVGQIEAVIGSSVQVVGTLMYDIRNPGSDGGGHVQTAAKGGTGQITYGRGDLLVGQSSSVLTKLAVGANGTVPTADSSAATGISWTNAGTTKVYVSASVVSIRSIQEGSVFSVSIPGSTLGTNNALRSISYITAMGSSGASILVRGFYGGANASLLVVLPPINSLVGRIEYTILANQSSVLQRNLMELHLYNPLASIMTANRSYDVYTSAVSSVNTTQTKTMGLVVHNSEDNTFNISDFDAVTVEKII